MPTEEDKKEGTQIETAHTCVKVDQRSRQYQFMFECVTFLPIEHSSVCQ